jgi:hypothetical protein
MLRKLFLTALLLLTLAACQVPGGQTPVSNSGVQATPPVLTLATLTPDLVPVVEPTATAAAVVSPTPPPAVEVVCPEASGDTIAYRNDAHGYCLLYPAGFTVETDYERPDDVLALFGPRYHPGGQEFAQVLVRVAFNGPADGLTAEQYAQVWQQLNSPDFALPSAPTSLGGQPATLVREIPGMFSEQRAFVVANGWKYHVSLLPEPSMVSELAEAANNAWDTITDSIVFYEPTVEHTFVRPQDVCPTATADTNLHVDLKEGICLLYPASFELDDRFSSGFVGGPVLRDTNDFGPIRASLVMASAGPAQGQTPRELLQPQLEYIDAASVQTTTIGGAPAVTFITPPPQAAFGARQALIVTNGLKYTIVNQPYDAQQFPEGMAFVDRIWNTAVDSIAFFDAWR